MKRIRRFCALVVVMLNVLGHYHLFYRFCRSYQLMLNKHTCDRTRKGATVRIAILKFQTNSWLLMGRALSVSDAVHSLRHTRATRGPHVAEYLYSTKICVKAWEQISEVGGHSLSSPWARCACSVRLECTAFLLSCH